jgi:hypothetical protein
MKKFLAIVVVLVASHLGLSAQEKPQLVIHAFTVAPGVELPYDMKLLQAQMVAELKVELGKDYNVISDSPTASEGTGYALHGVITGWRPGNAAKRMLVGMGSGRESSDIDFHVSDGSGKKVIERKETIRTNFYSQGAGSSGTLAHPIALKVSDRIKESKLK